ncbi:MAG: ABC transporter ATP-binding protein [Alphaproteobacteria bacterium]|nr:ABC transporter ATP-binding protein [Alphaproteobacteria bacterium]
MARVVLQRISKSYPGVKALDDIDLVIETGEFFTLLGPSGCGKTTLLRTIAGFNRHDSGHVLIGGRNVDDVPAYRRDIGMVYQDYAIFPHLSVSDNVAFGLKTRSRPRPEIAERVARALDLVQLGGHAKRLPHELSGGQQQRVALARAMVINPQILLMDEPLSNLDAKLRIELRDDIRALQRSLGITTIYVTHDQEEALVISDRICVMQGGRVHQVASPQNLYARPATVFVASFVGTMNVLADCQVGPGGALSLGRRPCVLSSLAGRARVTLAIRPEEVILPDAVEQADAISLDGVIDRVTFAGREAFYRIGCGDGLAILAHVHRPSERRLAAAGDTIRVALPISRLHAFDPADGSRIDLGRSDPER